MHYASPVHMKRGTSMQHCRHGSSISFLVVVLFSSVSRNHCSASDAADGRELTGKNVYKVGVLANKGEDIARLDWNLTFEQYLTAEITTTFSPLVQFKMVPLVFDDIFVAVKAKRVHFVFVNPTMFSCIESEIGAQSLVSIVNKRTIGSKMYELPHFAGVIFTKANRDDIRDLEDIRGKTVGTSSIASLGSGQMQFRQLKRRGLHFLQDPAQVVFTDDQNKVVHGVHHGYFDVGFVRTGVIERMQADGLGWDKFRMIGSMNKAHPTFPYNHSTELYPEWNVAALKDVPENVSLEVQAALLRIKNTSTAAEAGLYAGWRTTLSYMELRNMQEEIGFINRIEDKMECVKGRSIHEQLVCPEGYFKLPPGELNSSCADTGHRCPKGFDASQCICKPCVKASTVQVWVNHKNNESLCKKMQVCGGVPQGGVLDYFIRDNLFRSGRVSYRLHIGSNKYNGFAEKQLANSISYKISLRRELRVVGAHIMEVFMDDRQIAQSPFIIEVRMRNCEAEYGGALWKPTAEGECICASNAVYLFHNCLKISLLIPSVFVPCVLIVIMLVVMFRIYRRRQSDHIWKVEPSELNWSQPVEILGTGTFGFVVKAEYRGTAVAVKRVIPPGMRLNLSDPFQATKDSTSLPCGKSTSLFGTTLSGRSGTKSPGYAVSPYDSMNHTITPVVSQRRIATSVVQRIWIAWLRKESRSSMRRDFIYEMRMLSKLRHPCVTTVMGAVVSNSCEPMLIMELMDHGSLYDLIHNDTLRLEGELVLPILRDIAQGLQFLHAASPVVIHGDVKSGNVLVDVKFRAKVSDFGLSQKSIIGTRGTPAWMAPELLKGLRGTPESDVYAFGVLLSEIYNRKEPYQGLNMTEVLTQVIEANLRPEISSICSIDMAVLMKECWQEDAALRPKFQEIGRRLASLDAETVSPGSFQTSLQAGKQRDRRTKELLYDLFPKHVAEALREGRKVEPEAKDPVTIFFSDIVGFTDISSTLEPRKVSRMLDELYSKFDALSNEFDVFKVETIGDAYMAVTNLVSNQEHDHAKRIAQFALRAIEMANTTLIDPDNTEKGLVNIRVGFHSGPIVANVVGSRNLRYCLFGDTVNTASRMESTSIKNHIHCSATAAKYLSLQAPEIPLFSRGMRQIKGKGEMETFWVQSIPAGD